MSNVHRPGTSSTRPGTTDSDATANILPPSRRRPETNETLEEEEEEDWSEEEDDDPGMFSFLPPAPGSLEAAPNPNSLSPAFRQRPLDSNFSPSSDLAGGEDFSSSSSTLATQSTPPAISNVLSPAAAYALASALPTDPTRSHPTVTILDGARRRGTWQYPDSPTHLVQTQYTGEAFEKESKRLSELRDSDPLEESDMEDVGDSFEGHESRRGSEISRGTEKIGQRYWDERSDNSSLVVDEAVRIRMKAMGSDSKYAEEDKMLSMGEHGSVFSGLDPLDFEQFLDDEEDSPYPEVRASVSNIDDIEMPCLTFRSWFLGLTFTLIVGSVNVFFSFRYPAPIITPIIVQVMSYPCGKILAYLLPAKIFRVPKRLQRWGLEEDFSFNPGPFNIKEHTVIVIMANAASGPAYALNFSVASQKFYNVHQGIGFDFLLVLSTQLIGFGMAGICRRYLVWPAAMIWPQNLVFCTLLNTLHAEDDDTSDGGITRYKFFGYVALGAFCWFFLPGFLFQALSVFSWVCWIAPNNKVVNQLFGLSSGLGMSALTFDWSQIAYIGSPLVVPWWAEVNVFVGFVVAFWIVSPALYYSNTWFTSYLPMSTNSVYDRFGNIYNTSRVLEAGSSILNTTAYSEYSRPYLPVTFAAVYGISFTLSSAVLVHTALYHGKGIYSRFRNLSTEDDDIHAKLMKAYPEVPDWWYWIYLMIFGAMCIVTVAIYDVQLPIWALIIALFIPLIYILPAGFVFAMTSQTVSVNLIVELISGYLIPGQPLGNMLFKTYTINAVALGLSFVQDLKLGHYMKLPPRTTFLIQVVAAICAAFVQVGIKEMLMTIAPDLCDIRQPAHLICPGTRVFYSSSIIWGLIGPARQFSSDSLYGPLLYLILFGAILPIPFWFLGRRYPNSWLKFVNIPVMLSGATYMPPATGINYSSWFLVGFIFQYWMRRHRYNFWSRFNFLISAGMDTGTVLSGLVIFFVLQLPLDGALGLKWWGNTVFTRTDDWNYVPFRKLLQGEFFGPDKGW